MNTSLLYRFTAILLALLVLVTSVGLTVDRHFCGGEMKSFSLVGKAKTCYELATGKPQPTCVKADNKDEFQGIAFSKKPCCENKTDHFQTDTDTSLQSASDALTVQTQHFLVAYVAVFVQSYVHYFSPKQYLDYRPPSILRDIPVLIQSFLL